jgi:hypothetical protein
MMCCDRREPPDYAADSALMDVCAAPHPCCDRPALGNITAGVSVSIALDMAHCAAREAPPILTARAPDSQMLVRPIGSDDAAKRKKGRP